MLADNHGRQTASQAKTVVCWTLRQPRHKTWQGEVLGLFSAPTSTGLAAISEGDTYLFLYTDRLDGWADDL